MPHTMHTEAPPGIKLGKHPAVTDPRTARMVDFMDFSRALPVAHETHHSEVIAKYPMFGNDQYGDCVCAGIAHQIQLNDALNKRKDRGITTSDVLDLYTTLTGFNPNDPNTDQGTNMLDAWNHWRHSGCFGDKIAAFMSVNLKDWRQLMVATQLFESVGMGVALPITAQAQTQTGVWDTPATGITGDGAPGSWGGHCIPNISIDKKQIRVVTWGLKPVATARFLGTYGDEAYVALSDSEMNGSLSASGFKHDALIAYLAQL